MSAVKPTLRSVPTATRFSPRLLSGSVGPRDGRAGTPEAAAKGHRGRQRAVTLRWPDAPRASILSGAGASGAPKGTM